MAFQAVAGAGYRFVVLTWFFGWTVVQAIAQDFHQPAAAQVDVPAPTECRVSPRSREELVALGGTPAASLGSPIAFPSPVPLPQGEPVAGEVVVGITATIRELVACSNAGDGAREGALYSDDFVRRAISLVDVAVATSPAASRPLPRTATVEGSPEPPALAAMPTISDARRVEDGRVGAIVHFPSFEALVGSQAFYLFVRVGDRWLIDEVVLVEKGSVRSSWSELR
jgi:hypothetical protein